MPDFVPDWKLRQSFADKLSLMYRDEVPAYGDLVELVGEINSSSGETSTHQDSLVRLGDERHGAIRLALPEELNLIRRALRLLGMHPVGYYDLSPAGLPVHSTAFRPLTSSDMERNAFRLFTSLVRLDQISSDSLRKQAEELVAQRAIISPQAMTLIEVGERHGGLTANEGEQFVTSLMDTFRWRGEALSSLRVYEAVIGEHPLVADVVCFPNPHINHLTPRVVDIDQAQSAMLARGLPAKEKIEGPPKRTCPILLRQTAFRALDENVRFPEGTGAASGVHTARFGEIESRGAALTPKGMALYDACLSSGDFSNFPDDWKDLKREQLVWFRYSRTDKPWSGTLNTVQDMSVDELVSAGLINETPMTYEDFLPVSAAGIFRSNLKQNVEFAGGETSNRTAFEQALGGPVHDAMQLYADESEASLEAVIKALKQVETANNA
ncbi:MAG: DUF1338 domain-containing protein [Ponticaulis sp.]|nr:DUF1338 domain-containing protein [Ponticaulis sp.]